MSTCGGCDFYEPGGEARTDSGETFPAGVCFGAPPSVTNNRTEYPSVREDRRQCALFKHRKPIGKAKP